MRRLFALMLLAGAVAASRAEAVGLTAAAAFHTPGRAIECVIPVQHEGPLRPPLLSCWRPQDGRTFDMRSNSRPRQRLYRRHRGYHDWWAGRLRIPYGRDWTYSFDARGVGRFYFRCTSLRDGLRCRNRRGHGWFIGRTRGHRLF